ncbi:unnamed protein product, partial [Ectocarpus fasciculatus]
SYGKRGTKKAEFCSQHARPGMIDLVSKRCGHPGCIKHASHGNNGSKMREFCSQHAKPGMIDLVNKRCGHPG